MNWDTVARTPLTDLRLTKIVRRPTEEAIAAMAASLGTIGQLSPIGINPDNEVIFGVTRCLAAKKLGWKEILARKLPAESKPGEAFRMTVSENTVRSQMTFVEMADAIFEYAKLIGTKDLQKAGQELGYKQPQISKCIKTDERLTPANKKKLLDAGVGGSLAYLYSQEQDPEQQTALIEQGLAEKWTRKDIEKHFRQSKAGVIRLEYNTPQGKAQITVPKGSQHNDLIELLKAFAHEVHKCAKDQLTVPTMVQVLKERCHVEKA